MGRILVFTVAFQFVGQAALRGSAEETEEVIVGGDRPVAVYVPTTVDPEVKAPLVLALHGFGNDGQWLEDLIHLEPVAESRGLLYARPDGTPNPNGRRFWNATDGCCDFFGSGVDDSGYLRSLIEEIQDSGLTVDPQRIYVVGGSNGGFMAHRMACDHADTIAAVVSFAGANFLDPSRCAPTDPVHVLEIHGTADTFIGYGGGCILGEWCYPGAWETVRRWRDHNGCADEVELGPKLEIDGGSPGEETVVTRYAEECNLGGSAELWTIHGATHSPEFREDFAEIMVDWLLKHPKGKATRAAFTVTPPGGLSPLEVTVDGSTSTAAAGTVIASLEWSFGDGVTKDGAVATHTYSDAGGHVITLTVRTEDGQTDSITRTVHVSCPTEDVLPWIPTSVGDPLVRGGARFVDGEEKKALHICAGESGTGGTTDECLFVYQELSGDFRLTTRVAEFTSAVPSAGVGLMFRESLAEGARFAVIFAERESGPPALTGRFRFRYRISTDRSTAVRVGDQMEIPGSWVRIERHSDVLSGWSSLDGENWMKVNEVRISGLSRTLLGGVAAVARSSLERLDAVLSDLEAVPFARFIRGDANGDGNVVGDVTDAIFMLRYKFSGGAELPCTAAGDVDGDGIAADVSDAVYLLTFNFLGGMAPHLPFPSCGSSELPSDEELGCVDPPAGCEDSR